MRRALGRKNVNDPDASPEILLSYLNDAISLTMSDDVKVFENYGTLSFTIDDSTVNGVYTFNDVGAADQFVNIGIEAFISFLNPVDNSTSWNSLQIYEDPGEFYSIWGINNTGILVRGYPTMMLYYGNEFVFRTLPDREYLVHIYGYKQISDFPDQSGDLPFDYWLRYLAYLAASNYARDFRYPPDQLALIKDGYSHERKLLLTRRHNQAKVNRCMPRF
jgi:hypothetical protein